MKGTLIPILLVLNPFNRYSMSISLSFVLLKGNQSDAQKFNKVLAFDLDTYSFIRTKYNIVGKFIGILTDFKQQYNISNFPCEISIFEIYWLLKQLEGSDIIWRLYHNESYNVEAESFALENKEPLTGIPFRNDYTNGVDKSDILLKELQNQLEEDLDYKFYSYLKNKFKTEDANQKTTQYPCLISGLKFGGIYNLYLNDPLSIHSTYIVKNYVNKASASIPLAQLQSDIRLGSTTKKKVLVTFFDEKSDSFVSYTFQWAGF